jgi:hypothetical protein
VDLATTTDNNGFGLVVVMTNQGGGNFTSQTFASNGQNPDALVAADFDVDGDLDLATADEDSNLISALPNQGGTSFGAASTFAVGLHPSMLARADFDGNGSADLVVANRDSNNVMVLLNTQQGGGTVNYCISSANSAGPGAVIGSNGNLSVSANAFSLSAQGAPANQNGVFFFGSGQAQVPFGNGVRCVSGSISRLTPPTPINGAGNAVRNVNFTQPPANVITGTSVFNFQFWYRDPMGGGAAFNTSDGLQVTFQP